VPTAARAGGHRLLPRQQPGGRGAAGQRRAHLAAPAPARQPGLSARGRQQLRRGAPPARPFSISVKCMRCRACSARRREHVRCMQASDFTTKWLNQWRPACHHDPLPVSTRAASFRQGWVAMPAPDAGCLPPSLAAVACTDRHTVTGNGGGDAAAAGRAVGGQRAAERVRRLQHADAGYHDRRAVRRRAAARAGRRRHWCALVPDGAWAAGRAAPLHGREAPAGAYAGSRTAWASA